MLGEIAIERVGADRIEEMGPLYEALHEHHAAIAPALAGGAARAAGASWERRRAAYREWLSRPRAFALLARRVGGEGESESGEGASESGAGEVVGYAVVTVEPGYDSWDCGERVGDLHDIAVSPAARGAGLGRELMARVAAELAAAGVSHYRLLVLDGNDDAVRFYEREGLTTVVHQMLGRTTPAGG